MASLTQAGITFGDGTSQTTAAFPSGTAMLFVQSAAPTGWTKSTAHNDKSLRVVSGSVGSGGSVGFSAFTAQSIGATTLSTAQMPSHAHGTRIYWQNANGAITATRGSGESTYVGSNPTDAAGGGGSHTHSLNMALQYVDAIICSKD